MFEFRTPMYERSSIARLAQHYKMLLTGFLENSENRVLDVPLLTREEMNRVLMAWRFESKPFPDDACLHTLVERQVLRTPDDICLIFGSEHLSYEAFNQEANKLAAWLLQEYHLGEDAVVLCLERRPSERGQRMSMATTSMLVA